MNKSENNIIAYRDFKFKKRGVRHSTFTDYFAFTINKMRYLDGSVYTKEFRSRFLLGQEYSLLN